MDALVMLVEAGVLGFAVPSRMKLPGRRAVVLAVVVVGALAAASFGRVYKETSQFVTALAFFTAGATAQLRFQRKADHFASQWMAEYVSKLLWAAIAVQLFAAALSILGSGGSL